jgi:periplasmic divalent cation tolerance protein
MKSAAKFALVFVTAPEIKTARKLAKLALQTRLAACANLIPQVESHYWWRGRLEKSTEILMTLKTQQTNLPSLEALILKNHPYDTPEFLALPLSKGSTRYLEWLTDFCIPN